MDDETRRRVGGNESAFRKVNEALRAGKPLADADRLLPFRCECAVLGCNQLLELTLPEYEAIRADPTRFFLVDGHELPETETVVERHERYAVVEKFGEEPRSPGETDPRK